MTEHEYSKVKDMQKRCLQSDYYYFAKDLGNDGSKTYFAMSKKGFNDEYFNTNHSAYELIPKETPVKPYFDLEIDGEDDHTAKLTLFLDWLNVMFETEFQIKPTFRILDSCRDHKLSYHVLVDNCYVESVQALKPFIAWLWDKLIDYKELTWMYGTEKRCIMDKLPYGSNQCFRMINQCKKGKNHFLKGQGTAFENMVQNVSGTLLPMSKYIKKTPIVQKTFKQGNLNEKQLLIREEILEYHKFNLFQKVMITGSYDDWRNFGFAIFNTFGEDGLDLFTMVSQLNIEKYVEKEVTDFYKKLQGVEGKKRTINTIRAFAKKSDAKLFKRIFSMFIDKIEERRYCDTDNEACDAILDMLQDDLIFANKAYIKKDNVWVCNPDLVHAILINYIMNAPLLKPNDKADIPYWANYSAADKLTKCVLQRVSLHQTDYSKFHTTTKHRFCFLNGVLDFRTKKFYTWDEIDFEYYPIVQIPLEYSTGERDKIEEIEMNILKPLFGDKLGLAKKYLSRSLAGCSEDKNFATYLGNRDCGKGILNELLDAFGGYVHSFPVKNIMCERNRNGGDSSRELYWLMDFEYVRLAISQEIPEECKGWKLQNEKVKMICSGGDTLTARRNYDRVDTKFKTQASLFLMGNDSIAMDGDVKEHLLEFSSAVQYKTKEFIDSIEDEMAKKKYRVADPSLKQRITTVEYKMAFVQLMLDSYEDKVIQVELENDVIDPLKNFKIEWEITNNLEDIVIGSDLTYLGKKIKDELQMIGVTYKQCSKGEYRKKWCFYGIKKKSDDPNPQIC